MDSPGATSKPKRKANIYPETFFNIFPKKKRFYTLEWMLTKRKITLLLKIT